MNQIIAFTLPNHLDNNNILSCNNENTMIRIPCGLNLKEKLKIGCLYLIPVSI